MSLEQSLERIAIAVEQLAARFEQTDVIGKPPEKQEQSRMVFMPPAVSGASVPPIAPAALAAPPGPPAAPPGPPGPPAAPPGPSAAPPGPSGPPAAPPGPSVAPPVQAVPNLDDIRALATDFHRAHPERAAEVVGILASAGARTLSEVPPDRYPVVYTQLKALVGG